MTRGQRKAHALVFRVLAVFFVLALGWALSRRATVASTDDVTLGRASASSPAASGATP